MPLNENRNRSKKRKREGIHFQRMENNEVFASNSAKRANASFQTSPFENVSIRTYVYIYIRTSVDRNNEDVSPWRIYSRSRCL